MNRKKLLLVEDDRIISLAVSKTVRRYGYEVVTADTGEEAVKVIKENESIALILMDFNLGEGINGVEAAFIILDIRKLPVIFFTSHSEDEIDTEINSSFRYSYIKKGSDKNILISLIEKNIDIYSARKM